MVAADTDFFSAWWAPGAVAGSALLPKLRRAAGNRRILVIGTGGTAIALVALGLAPTIPAVVLALVVVGPCWIMVLSSVNARVQMLLPAWVRARGLGFYLVVFQGAQAVGAAVWGWAAQTFGIGAAFVAAATLLASSCLVMRRARFDAVEGIDQLSDGWPDPTIVLEPSASGLISVHITYSVRTGDSAAFREIMRDVRRARQRTGAVRWRLLRDVARPTRWMETYEMCSWADHMRQHHEYFTVADQSALDRSRSYSVDPIVVDHLASADNATSGDR